MPYWTAHLQNGRANLALSFLRQFGYEPYYPLIAGRRAAIPTGLFPGYAFVRVTDHWWDAAYCPGVCRLIRNGERPAEIADHIINEIRRREGRDGLVRLPKAPKPRGLQPGDRVRIMCGPLEGQLATLHSSMNGHQRVTVLLTWLGAERHAVLSRDAVRAVRAP